MAINDQLVNCVKRTFLIGGPGFQLPIRACVCTIAHGNGFHMHGLLLLNGASEIIILEIKNFLMDFREPFIKKT